MKMWIARDECGSLWIHRKRPKLETNVKDPKAGFIIETVRIIWEQYGRGLKEESTSSLP